MTTARWLRIKAIFHEVADLDPTARAAVLQERCGDDAELLRDVGSLLLADDRASSFIAHPPVLHVAPQPKTIGPFRVVREIGRGGMGIVYLAEREGDFSQRVAIKVISAGLGHSDHVIRRFRAEREILARLEHPNVARLLDGGTTVDGLPYFVMEYVEGTPIDRYCRDRMLALRERLELFLRVCAAVQYAHQNLVIHRDLKPGNILITDRGEPKLLDFGIARVVDDSTGAERTATEFRAMTPEYASPEQILGQPLATTSDVYSLGVVLFELLTDRKAHRLSSAMPGEIARVVLEAEPERPSAVVQRSDAAAARALRGDLDNIVQMALRKEPARRYASVQALGEDIRRHLDGLPVTARPDTIGYRTAKFVGRNRFAVAASLLLVLALVGGIAATSWQAIEARRSQQKAERRFAQLRRLAQSLIYDLDEEIAGISGTTSAREKLVSTALEYLDSLAAEADDRGLQLELALAYQRVGAIQGNSYDMNLGQTAAARTSYGKSLRILQALEKENPADIPTLEALARAYMGVGDVEFGADLESTEAHYRKSIAVWQRVQALAPLTLAQTRTFALVISRHGDVAGNPGYANLGRLAEAAADYRQALAMRESLLRQHPDNERVQRDVAESLTKLSYLANSSGDFERAAAINQRAIDLMRQIAANNPQSANDQHDLSFTLMNAAFPLRDLGRTDEGIRSLEESRRVMEWLAARDTASVLYRRNLSVINNHLSGLLLDAGRNEEALAASSRALKIAEELWNGDRGNDDARLDLVIALRRNVEALLALGRLQDVLRQGSRGAAAVKDLAARGNQRARFEQAVLEARVGAAEAGLGRTAEGTRGLEQATAMFEAMIAGGASDVRTRDELALAHFHLGRASRCGSYRRAIVIWEEMAAAKTLPFRSRRYLDAARAAVPSCRG